MATFERTWEWGTGQDLGLVTYNDTLTLKVGIMLGLKEALIGNYWSWTAPWTVAGSGGANGGSPGGGMDAVDRWGVFTDADATNNWMCLRGPTGTAFQDIWFTMINTGTGGTQRFVVTDAAPTGGGETTLPTFSGKIIDTGSATQFSAASFKVHRMSVGITTQGGWYMLHTDGDYNHPSTMWGLLEVADGKSGDLPCCFLVDFPGLTPQGLDDTADLCRMYHNDGSTVTVQILHPTCQSDGAVLEDFNGWSFDEWSGGEIPDFPVYLWSSTAGKRAFRGRIIDLYVAPDSASNNTVEPTSGPPYESVKFGAFWWPGATSKVVY